MVTNTGAWSEIARLVLLPGEGYTSQFTHTHSHKGTQDTHKGIRALREAVALFTLITSTGHRWI